MVTWWSECLSIVETSSPFISWFPSNTDSPTHYWRSDISVWPYMFMILQLKIKYQFLFQALKCTHRSSQGFFWFFCKMDLTFNTWIYFVIFYFWTIQTEKSKIWWINAWKLGRQKAFFFCEWLILTAGVFFRGLVRTRCWFSPPWLWQGEKLPRWSG